MKPTLHTSAAGPQSYIPFSTRGCMNPGVPAASCFHETLPDVHLLMAFAMLASMILPYLLDSVALRVAHALQHSGFMIRAVTALHLHNDGVVVQAGGVHAMRSLQIRSHMRCHNS